jgi:hypothetical protein
MGYGYYIFVFAPWHEHNKPSECGLLSTVTCNVVTGRGNWLVRLILLSIRPIRLEVQVANMKLIRSLSVLLRCLRAYVVL